MTNQRYASYGQIPPKKGHSQHSQYAPPKAATLLLKKDHQVDVVKRRISALCVRQQKYSNRSVNTDLEYERKADIQRQTERIQRLLQNQKKKQAKDLNNLRYRNLQTRADNYFKTRMAKDKKYKEVLQQSQNMRSKSREFHSTISENKTNHILNNQMKSRAIYEHTKYAQEERSRLLNEKRTAIISMEKKQNQHLRKLEQIKDYQLSELGRLQLMMVQKSNTSRAAYQAKRERLSSRSSSKSKYETSPKLSNRRQKSKHSLSMNIY